MPPIDIPAIITQASPLIIPVMTAILGYQFGHLRDSRTAQLSRETELLTEIRAASVQCISAATQRRDLATISPYTEHDLQRDYSRAMGEEIDLTEDEREYKVARESLNNALARLQICAPHLVEPAWNLWNGTNNSAEEWEKALRVFSERAAGYLNPPGRVVWTRQKAG